MITLRDAQRFPARTLELYQLRQFIDQPACTALIKMIDARRRPSEVNDDQGDPTYRTSETCDLDPAEPLVASLLHRIAGLLSLDPAHGEPMQGQRYAVGQQFKAHTDYFEPDGADFRKYCAKTGQRTWTAMIYLNEPLAGGATRFRQINKTFHPETGKLLCWNNLLPDGRPNFATLHQGMPVRQGLKYVITQWFRERPWAG